MFLVRLVLSNINMAKCAGRRVQRLPVFAEKGLFHRQILLG